VEETVAWLKDIRVRTVSLADTAGNATPEIVADVFKRANEHVAGIELGAHLHSRPEDAEAKILAAYQAGCRRFDGALTGLGGCPFAGDELVGNIRTEDILSTVKKAGGDPGLDESRLVKVLAMTNDIRMKYAHAPIAS
jgi:hydroxymethylglutaryl-CoA lyase